MKRIVATAGLLLPVMLAAAGPGDVAPVSLLEPEVYKLDWNTRSMIAHDLDGDGKRDLILLNNDRAKIDVLYQRKPGKPRPASDGSPDGWQPLLEDARFQKKSVATGGSMYALAAGDFDGDGRVDLAFTGKPDPLTVMYQGKGDDWTRRQVLEIDEPVQWTRSLLADDLDADGRQDLVVLSRTQLLVYRQDANGELSGALRLPLSDPGCFGLLAHDLNGDGRTDLSYLAPKSESSWRMRLQHDGGGFGPEQAFHLPTPASALHPIAIRSGDGVTVVPMFAAVQRQTQLLELVALEEEGSGGDPISTLRPRIYATPNDGPATYALGDFDGDGEDDLAVSAADGAAVEIYPRQPDGSFGLPTRYPSLPDVRAMAAGDADGDGRAELFVVSPDEATVASASMSDQGRLTYPKPLPGEGRPLALAVGDLDGDRKLDVVTLYEQQGARYVGLLEASGSGEWSQDGFELEGLRTNPDAVRILDANQDGAMDLAIFVVQSPLMLWIQQDDGSFAEATRAGGFRPGLVDKLRPESLSVGDVDGDGKPEMLVGGTGFARALRLAPSGELVVVDQFNARDSATVVQAAATLDLDGDGVTELLLSEKGGETLELLRKGKDGVFRFDRSVAVGAIELLGIEPLATGDRSTELLLLGTDRFWWLPVGRDELQAQSRFSRETDLERMGYIDLAVGDLNHDGHAEIAVIDSADTRLLEVLAVPTAGEWRSVLHFTVFESDPHYQGRRGANTEPREMLISDLTGDGKADLALLVHDRVLLYPQE